MLFWETKEDENIFISFRSLVKKKRGLFKSLNQSKFFMRNYRNGSIGLEHIGVEAEEGQWVVTANALTNWGTYTTGPRGQIPVMFAWVCDKYGIVKEYRIGIKGNLAIGARPEPSKTKVIWSRDFQISSSIEKEFEEAPVEPVKLGQTCPSGRKTIKGKILSIKGQYCTFGWQTVFVEKMLVESEKGFKVWGTLPMSFKAEVGDTIQFDARIEPSDKDLYFGFFKRPTKLSVIEKDKKIAA